MPTASATTTAPRRMIRIGSYERGEALIMEEEEAADNKSRESCAVNERIIKPTHLESRGEEFPVRGEGRCSEFVFTEKLLPFVHIRIAHTVVDIAA